MLKSDLDERQLIHRRRWEEKKSVRLLYEDFHRQLLDSCPKGEILDIGGGTAHLKRFRPDILSTDIQLFPGIDVVADAHKLPFQDGSFAGVVMLDVLHHLERPIEFLTEAARVLKRGGRLAMLEPAMTPVAGWFYDHVHEEPVDMTADPFAPIKLNPARDPFDANIAIPHLLFATPLAQARTAQAVPWLQVRRVDWLSLFAYPMSGGFQKWSLIPASLVEPILAFEAKIPKRVRSLLAFRMMIVLERISRAEEVID
jgi:SAM-dependent methyltransferase